LVSPYSMSSDEYYRSYPLIQQDFGIALLRTINVFASTGVQLFIPSVMGYGKDGNYMMTLLVQSADYTELGMDNAVTPISWPVGVTVVDVQTVATGCLVASSFTCGQIFTVELAAECSADDATADLSGNYQFGFTPRCRESDDSADRVPCEVFVDSLDGGDLVLDVESYFVDDCSSNLFEVVFEGDLRFYLDANFTEQVVDGSDPFVIGQDTIYGKVGVDIPSDADGAEYQFVGVEIEAVYVCTAEDDLSLTLNASTGIGGCFSSSIDPDGPYTVIGSGAVAKYQGNTTYDVGGSNGAAFSFLTFDTPRTTIYVHVQLLLTVSTESGEVRRRMLLQTASDGAEGNQFKSYMGTATVQEGETTIVPLETDGAAGFSVGFVPAMIVAVAWMMMVVV